MLNRSMMTYIVGAMLLAAIVFLGVRARAIDKAPKTVMTALEARIVAGAGGWNACYHNRTYGPRMEAARRANPDSIITSMAYDLADGPVRVSGKTWPRYWSLSLYQQNSDNYFVVNDQQLASADFDYVIAMDGQKVSASDGSRIVSPTQQGIMLIRRFAAEEDDMPAIIENQDAMQCGVDAGA